MTNIFVVVVTYNGMQWYDRCLGSLRESDLHVSVVIVDNASTDGTIDFIETNYPEVHLVKSDVNLGFAKANNIGIKYAMDCGAEYVFLLNQDAWIGKKTLLILLETFTNNEGVGIASPIHLNGQATSLDVGFSEYMNAKFLSDSYMGNIGPYYEVPFVNAAAWLISAECINVVGGFDVGLFVHCGEDDNYCQRVIFHGFKIMVCTKCSICHDREFRDDVKYNKDVLRRNPFKNEKVIYGNVNQSYSFTKLKFYELVLLIESMFLLSKEQVILHWKRIEVFNEIIQSRKKNVKKGLTWL